MRFIDTKRFSPVLFGGDVPNQHDLFWYKPEEIPKNDKEFEKFLYRNNVVTDRAWWMEQARRCRDGYTVPNAIDVGGDCFRDGIEAEWHGNDCYIHDYNLTFKNKSVFIPGRYYFYLNFWPIYGKMEGASRKSIIRPKFTDVNFLFARRLEMMIEQGLNNQETKARQLGFSEAVAGLVAGYEYTFHKASLVIIVAGAEVDALKTMDNSTRGLDFLRNTQFWLDRSIDSRTNIRASNYSEIVCLTAKDNEQTVSRYTPTWVIYEEVGKGKKEWSIRTSNYVNPSLYAENGNRTGYELFIGTGGDMEEGAYDLEQRYYAPESHGCLKFPRRHSKNGSLDEWVASFTPKWMFRIIDKDGNSLREVSVKAIEAAAPKERDKAYTYWINWAIHDEDVFRRSTGGYFGKDIIMYLSERLSKLKVRRELQITKKGRLRFKDPQKPFGGVEFIEDNQNYWIEILEEPEKDSDDNVYLNLYVAGTDSYDKDEAESSNSKGSMYIKKQFRKGQESPHYNCYVAEIIERPKVAEGGADLFYMHTAMACIWYNCRNNIEWGNLRIYQWYVDHGFEVLLAERPQLAFANKINRSMNNERYGTDPSLKPFGLAILKDVLTPDFINRMFFINQIMAFIKFQYVPGGDHRKYNCDITMASMEAEIMSKEYESFVVKSKAQILKKKKGIIKYRYESGKMVQQLV